MNRAALASLAILALTNCDEPKATPAAASASVASALRPAPPPPPSATASAAPGPKAPVVCDPKVVTFTQPGLEAEIRRKLQNPDGALTPADLAKVKSVNLASVPVNDLDPCIFPLLKGMKDLFLGRGEVADLSPLASLTQVQTLSASDTKIGSLKPLEKITKMDRIFVSKTPVSDLSPLAGMTELTELYIDETPVSDLSPIAKCTKLEKLSLKQTQVKDLKPVLGMKKLVVLLTAGSPIEDTRVVDPLVKAGLKYSPN
jgi:internalin A